MFSPLCSVTALVFCFFILGHHEQDYLGTQVGWYTIVIISIKGSGVSFRKKSGENIQSIFIYLLQHLPYVLDSIMLSDLFQFKNIKSFFIRMKKNQFTKPIALIYNTQYVEPPYLFLQYEFCVECSHFVTFSLVWNYLENTTEILSTASRHLAIHKKYYYNTTRYYLARQKLTSDSQMPKTFKNYRERSVNGHLVGIYRGSK